MPERIYLTVGEVLQMHRQQIEEYGGIHGIRDKRLLESAVFRPQTGYYNNLAEEASALMESLANNHLSSTATNALPSQRPTLFCSSMDMIWK